MASTGEDEDTLGRLVGGAGAVRDAFDQMPAILMATAGPDHRVIAMNAACRAATRRAGVIGLPCRDLFPEVDGQQVFEMLDRVYASGRPETGREWRAQVDRGRGELEETYVDFLVSPRHGAGDAVTGLLVVASEVTGRVRERQTADADAEQRAAAARDLQEALLPTALPVLPRARIAARYLVAGHDRAAGGDWFDAIPLAGGRVALVVGDVVGHGVAAAAAMGQLRAVLGELLAAGHELPEVLRRADAFAARTPALRAATLALAVLDPADGAVQYTTCGHPPPLVIGDGGPPRFLPGTGTGPLGTGSPPRLAASTLAPGELLLLYTDGLIERPHRTMTEGLAELAEVAADAAANKTLTAGAPASAAQRVCQLTVELLTRTGYADDVTALAAERLAAPVPALRLELPSERASLTRARDAFTGWLTRLDAEAEDAESLHLAMVEVVTNAIEHAYPPDRPGPIELTAALDDDGCVECLVTDHGRWQPPDPGQADRGHGLMVAGHLVDTMLVSHPADGRGTAVLLRLRLRRSALLATKHDSALSADHPPGPRFTVETSTADTPAGPAPAGGGMTARALVRGAVDITTAGRLTRLLLSASRGGTVSLIADLTGVTLLASAGVQALYQVRTRLHAHAQELTLVTAPGSSAQAVLDLVRLPHVPGPVPGAG